MVASFECEPDESDHGVRVTEGGRPLPGDLCLVGLAGHRVVSAVVFDGGDFRGAQFSGSTVYFDEVSDWSIPPKFPWVTTDAPPEGVFLPPGTPIGATPS
jgi:hypothetical protein